LSNGPVPLRPGVNPFFRKWASRPSNRQLPVALRHSAPRWNGAASAPRRIGAGDRWMSMHGLEACRSQFAIRECRIDIMVLKPQDVYVALKIVATQADRAPYSQLAAELAMSPSEVHACVQRAQRSGLLHGPGLKNRPNFSALEEFLLHGLKYVFPPERGELTKISVKPLPSGMGRKGDSPVAGDCLFRSVLVGSSRILTY